MHEWVGLGPSAATQHDGIRSANPSDLGLWLADVTAGRRATTDRVALTNDLLAADSVIFGLRMNDGVSRTELYGVPLPQRPANQNRETNAELKAKYAGQMDMAKAGGIVKGLLG